MAGEINAEQTAPTQAPARGAIQLEEQFSGAEALLEANRARPFPVVSREGRLIGVLALEELLVCIDQHMDHIIAALSREIKRCKMTLADR